MNLLVMSGGNHPYEESTPILESFLKNEGHEVTVTENASVLSDQDKMNGYDALVFNTMRTGDDAMTRSERAGMTSYIENGKGFVCIHISGCAAEDWPEFYDITGGGWVLGKSYHPPYGQFTVNVNQSTHPGALGISDFVTNDELYLGNIEYKDGNDVFITSNHREGTYPRNNPKGDLMHMPGGTFPLGWTRMFGRGRVYVTLLGHNGLSFQTPQFQQVILNGVRWVAP